MNVLDLARPEIRALAGYASARSEAGRARFMLNANESPWSPNVRGASGLNRYPEPQPALLVARLAELYGVAPECLLATRGSDEAIDLLLRVFCRPGGDAALICPPTFGMYAVAAAVQSVAVREAPLGADWLPDAGRILSACTPRVRLVFLCSPNNPTGGLWPLARIRTLARALADRAVVVVDEAYLEFAGTPSAASLLAKQANVAVLRTLSKAWGMAGARVGCLIARPEVVALCRRVMAPYPLPAPSVKLAVAALADPAATAARVATLVAERERLAARLALLPGVEEVLPSQANFLCVRFIDAEHVRRALAVRGILVRDVSAQPRLEGCLRISVGAPVENARLVAALAESGVAA